MCNINIIKKIYNFYFLKINTLSLLLKSFDSKVSGTISKKISGKGWGYDPIFIPSNYKKTFAQLKNKNEVSHRFKALKKFASWYLDS